MEPGTYISIAQIAFQGACVAVKTFRKGLNFNQDAERLVLALEMERFRLQIWGENAGLSPPEGQPPTLPSRLLPICSILNDYLEQIQSLVKDGGGLTSRYGLSPTEDPPTKSELVRKLVGRMHQSIRRAGVGGDEADDDAKDGDEAGDGADGSLGVQDLALQAKRSQLKPTVWKRARWAVRDLDKFDNLVKDLAQRISKLNDLMTETQQRKTREDNYRVNMVVVGSAVDEASLELIRAAVQGESDTSQVRAAIERKALAVTDSDHGVPQRANTAKLSQPLRVGSASVQPLSLDHFLLPNGFTNLKRFITVKNAETDGPYFLFERKPFDANTLPQDMARLTSRIQRLVLLLQKPKSPEFKTPIAISCIKDTTRYCWWIVYRFPLHEPNPKLALQPLTKHKGSPVSLLSLMKSTAKIRPPLEQRITLASTLCATFSELYLSGWMHKGIRSDNVLFPMAGLELSEPIGPDQVWEILASPLICGFDYSRHESEWATIDKARSSGDLGAAIYRHPNYQGEAAEGYKVQYDVYSVGLILVEIALWVPLRSFLDATKKSSSSSATGSGSGSSSSIQLGTKPASVNLSADMKTFHAPHALELKKRVLGRVDNELAFRVGSTYCQAVKFCLEFADRQTEGDALDGGEVGVHPAMEFYDNVVVPLASLPNLFGKDG